MQVVISDPFMTASLYTPADVKTNTFPPRKVEIEITRLCSQEIIILLLFFFGNSMIETVADCYRQVKASHQVSRSVDLCNFLANSRHMHLPADHSLFVAVKKFSLL